MHDYDVVIVGGGLVGASLIPALSSISLKIAMVDQFAADHLYAPALDNRGLALSYLSTQILSAFGVWQKLAANAYPIAEIHVSTKGKFGFTKISASALKIPLLGAVVSASELGKVLLTASGSPQVDVKRPATIQQIDFDFQAKRWRIVTGTESFTCKLLIGADGLQSPVRAAAGIGVTKQDYRQTAIVCNVNTQVDTNIAFERFTESGILALLPFGHKRMKCVLTVDNDNLQNFDFADDQKFLGLLQELFGFRLGRVHGVSERKLFPVMSSRAHHITDNAVILLGNAANTLHPVAAQGFNLGLRDVMVLAELLEKHDLQEVPRLFAARRVSDHTRAADFTNKLATMSSNMKHVGILAAQLLPALNQAIARRGIGAGI